MKITVGIPQKDREEAAALYWDAFGEKLGFTLGPKYQALMFVRDVLRPDHGICAHDDDGRLLGIAGFKTVHGSLVGGDFKDMRKTYGWISAAIRMSLLSLLEKDFENERFLMDGLFVAPEMRGKGVGTALLDAVIDEARRRGYVQVRLDVVDTNPRAKALYRHVGFRELRTVKIGPLKYIFGFSASTTMVRDV